MIAIAEYRPMNHCNQQTRNAVYCITSKRTPHRKFTAVKAHRRKPMWMSEKVMTKLRKKKVAFNRWMQTKDGHDYQEYAKARNAAKTETRRAVRDFEKEVAKQAKRIQRLSIGM